MMKSTCAVDTLNSLPNTSFLLLTQNLTVAVIAFLPSQAAQLGVAK